MTSLRRSLVAAVLLGGLLLLDVPSAQGWQPIASSRPTWCGSAPYALGRVSSDLGDSTTESEVRRGMDQWTTVSCTSLTTSWQGRTGSTAGSRDRVSMIGWVGSGWPHSSSAIGVTQPQWSYDGCIAEADMQMNGVNYTWTTDSGYGGTVNAFSIILHEGGHYYGLGHTSDRGATMYASYSGGISSLNSDDQEGICTLYPGEGGGTTPECEGDSDCGSTESCDGGTCVPDTSGDGTVCAPCTTSSECGTTRDLCLQYPDGSGHCGKACSNSSDCGDGQQCATTSAGQQCVAVDGSGNISCADSTPTAECSLDTDCGPEEICDSSGSCVAAPTGGGALGDPCSGPDECASGRCTTTPSGGVCSRTCDWLDPTSCPSGFYCDGDATGICGGDNGVCMAGSAGSASLGDSCGQDTDCASLYCSGGTCAAPCVPDGTVACPDGLKCQVGASTGCGACKRAGDVGDRCDTNEDCVTRYCAERGDGDTFCTDLCSGDADCPPGFTCEGTAGGDVSVCVPPEDGGIGDSCETVEDCVSGLCTSTGICTDECFGDADCPSGFDCKPVAGGDLDVCAPGDGGSSRRGGGGCGCSAPGGAEGSAPLTWLAGIAGALVLWRRRRRR